MKVLCCGSRKWTNKTVVLSALLGLEDEPGPAQHEFFKSLNVDGPIEIVHGNALGADSICDWAARILKYTIHRHPANWDKHGKAAGPIRNQEMLDKHPDIYLVLAFTDNIEESKGTADMVRRARKKGIPVRIIKSDYVPE